MNGRTFVMNRQLPSPTHAESEAYHESGVVALLKVYIVTNYIASQQTGFDVPGNSKHTERSK